MAPPASRPRRLGRGLHCHPISRHCIYPVAMNWGGRGGAREPDRGHVFTGAAGEPAVGRPARPAIVIWTVALCTVSNARGPCAPPPQQRARDGRLPELPHDVRDQGLLRPHAPGKWKALRPPRRRACAGAGGARAAWPGGAAGAPGGPPPVLRLRRLAQGAAGAHACGNMVVLVCIAWRFHPPAFLSGCSAAATPS